MIAIVVLCTAQTALIWALLVQRSRRRLAEEALRTSEAALRSSYGEAQHLAGRLIAGQESERYRLARDLHDNLSQKLALLCIDIRRVRKSVSVSPSTTGELVTHLLERANDIASDVHCMSHDLHPTKLDVVGLAPAVEGLCRDVARQYNIRVDFQQQAMASRVPAAAALCLFRITQEALQNVVKHSGAKATAVRLAQTGQHIRLHIADCGRGFDGTSNGKAGLGLLSMRERVYFAGGRIHIRTATGRGTHIVVSLPMDEEGPIGSAAPRRRVRASGFGLPLRSPLRDYGYARVVV